MEIRFADKIYFTCPDCNREFTYQEGQSEGVPFFLVKCPGCGYTDFIDGFEEPNEK